MNLISKKTEKKRKEKAFKRGTWLIHYVKVIYINTVFEKHFSSKNIYIFWYSLVNDEVPSSFSQTVEQVEDIQWVSNMKDLALDKRQGD